MTPEEKLVLNQIPQGRAIGNTRLMRRLGWAPAQYFPVRSALIEKGLIALGRGRGGSVRRIDTLGDRAESLMALVPADGSPIGNQNLREQLNWDEPTYWSVRNDLLARGLIGRGRGRGGAVFRIVPDAPLDDVADIEDDAADDEDELEDSGWYVPRPGVDRPKASRGPRIYEYERDMYADLRQGLYGWARDHQLQDNMYSIRDTADQGGKATGIWSRPDAVILGIRYFPLINRRVLEAITFEAKLRRSVDIRGIHEASAHRRFSTHSYAFFQVTEEQMEDVKFRDEMQEEAIRVGVGLIFATEVDNFSNWDELVKARAHQPDLELLEQFVREQLGGKDVADALWDKAGRGSS